MVTKGRVRISKDKAEFVRLLKMSDNPSAPFQTYADLLTFAATLGAKHNRRVPLAGVSLKNPDPVPIDQFITRGYGPVIGLLALTSTSNPQVLAMTDYADDQRVEMFEEYTNAGLEILQTELVGAVDYSDQVLLLLLKERQGQTVDEFDLTKFLQT